jgi:glutamate dehydrogenase (NADP+)
VKELKNNRHGRIKEYVKKYPDATYRADRRPWGVAADIYLPCATQNEIDEAGAKQILAHRPHAIAEGANMPTTPAALVVLQSAGVLFAPAKASNAGGVAVSGLEMSQNMTRLPLPHEDIDEQLRRIMRDIHTKCVRYGKTPKGVDYARGANIAGFVRVADAIIAQGAV